MRLQRLALLVSMLWLGAGCASPVGVSLSSPREIHRYLTQSALSANQPSMASQIELHRFDLVEAFEDDPEAALLRLHEIALASGLRADELFALAELSFLVAEKNGDRRRHAAAAIYAYAFLFPEEDRPALDPLDPRSRTAADLYNRALASALARKENGDLVGAQMAELDLPFGHFTGTRGPDPDLGGYRIDKLYAVTELEVRGFRNRYRRPGIGAPLAATLLPTDASAAQPVPIGPNAHMPLTAVIRIENPLAQIRAGQISGQIDLFESLDEDWVEIGDTRVDLESEPTAAFAAGLSESQFWKREIGGFLGDLLGVHSHGNLISLRPYAEGRIPVVFVHGTASSPGRWADMVNDLAADDRLRKRFTFWFFSYDSGNPIVYSAWQLRDGLTQAVERADPSGGDPCLRDMLVLGHSQGGLLTKMTSVDPGDAFWRGVSSRPLEKSRLSDKGKQMMRNLLFVEPLPFVRRVIFLATPHRGSYLAGPQFVRRLAQKLVRFPADVVHVGADLMASGIVDIDHLPTSIDNMSPGNRFIRELAEVPVVPRVTAHSIIAVKNGDPLEKASDGVVRYASAHVEGVESELVVHSPHSGMQAAPETIEEVRRILLEHSGSSACPVPSDVALVVH